MGAYKKLGKRGEKPKSIQNETDKSSKEST